MNIAIWGTKKEAIYLKNQLSGSTQHKVICFVDNDYTKWGMKLEGIIICSFEQLRDMYPEEVNTVIVAVRNGHSITSIMNQLKSENIGNVGLLKLSVFDYQEKIEIENGSRQIIWIATLEKPLFTYLQVVLVKKCNMNCKGCTHFANLFNKEKISENDIYEFEDYKRDLATVAINTEIYRLRLLGGEPFLYPNLSKVLAYTREVLPDVDIRVVTNGILVPSCKKELLECIAENRIGLDISPYKPTVKLKPVIEKVLRHHHIKYNFEGIDQGYIESFEKNIDIKGINNPLRSMQFCHSKQCRTLFDGVLYKCPYDAFIAKFFDYFFIDRTVQHQYNVRESTTNWKQMIIDLHNNPVEACKYCSEKKESFQWDITVEPKITDWTVD